MRLSMTIAWAALAMITSAALGYDVNKDLVNTGTQPAHDLAIVLAGTETVTGHYDGYPGRRFGSFSWGPSGANTLLHWQNVIEPSGNGVIDPGEMVHVGWTTADHSSHVLDMYWTDASGNRIPGSKILNVTSGWTYETAGFVVVDWHNIFTTDWGEVFPIEILELAVGVFPEPWPLAELNWENQLLNDMLVPMPGGSFVVGPQEAMTLTLPFDVPPGSAVVLRYFVTGPGSDAFATDWVQFETPPLVAPGYFVNKDLVNTGTQPAHDVAIVLAGTETVTGHYDGYPGRRFGSFSWGPSGANTLLHWQNVIEPDGNGVIDPGEMVHVGWSTADGSSHVLDMYWTDASGNRIPGSKILNITSGWTYETAGYVTVDWHNIFTTEWGEMFPIEILELAVGVFPEPWPLEELNWENQLLNDMLEPMPGGSFVLEPQEAMTLALPFDVPPGSAVVLRYFVTGPGSDAWATDWVQFLTPAGPDLGACCVATTCYGTMTLDECMAFEGEWFPGMDCDSPDFGCPGEEVRCTPGDINGDGLVNAFDIDPFVAVLVGVETDPDWVCSADCNGDGLVNAFDIDPFVALLVSTEPIWVGYEKPCDGQNRVWAVNPPAGRTYLVKAQKGADDSDCPVTVEARNSSGRLVGAALALAAGDAGEFTVPAGTATIVYRCHVSSGSTCRFSWLRFD